MLCVSFVFLVFFFKLLKENCAFKVKNMEFGRKLEKVPSKYDRAHHSAFECKCAWLLMGRAQVHLRPPTIHKCLSAMPQGKSYKPEYDQAHLSTTYALVPFLGF
jgi:hypothetical protein